MANHYVRQGATGTGSGNDWTNAYTTLPATLTRGDTYYIADGTYGSYTFDDVVLGTLVITVKKATIADHGTETGWADSYGDGQAAMGAQLRFNTSYFVVDGNSPNWSYGLTINNTSFSQSIYMPTGSVTNITVKGIDVEMNGADRTGVTINGGSNMTISNCAAHNMQGDGLAANFGSNVLIEYFHVYDRAFGAHGDAFQFNNSSDITIRYSKFDWDGQQVFMGGVAPGNQGAYTIYGNLFYGGATSGKGLHRHDNAIMEQPVLVYNNSFYGLNNATDLGDGVVDYRNNIFYNYNSISLGGSSHTYNYYQTGNTVTEATKQTGGDPFVNAGADNFALAFGTTAGDSTIGGTYATDFAGIARSIDGTWDRGAYEYDSGVIPSLPPFHDFIDSFRLMVERSRPMVETMDIAWVSMTFPQAPEPLPVAPRLVGMC